MMWEGVGDAGEESQRGTLVSSGGDWVNENESVGVALYCESTLQPSERFSPVL